MRLRNRPVDRGRIYLADDQRLVVPVVSSQGGVGRSTVAALLAAVLRRSCHGDPADRGIAVADTAPRGRSVWPGWLDTAATSGIAARLPLGEDWDRIVKLLPAITSTVRLDPGPPIAVWADTGPLQTDYLGAYPGPRWWAPLLAPARGTVIDADATEGHRLVRQAAGGPGSAVGDWLASPAYLTAVVWVTTPAPVALGQVLTAVTAAEWVGLTPSRRFVLVVNDLAGRGLVPRAKAKLALLRDRVARIVHLPYLADLATDTGRPPLSELADGERTAAVNDLFHAVAEVAGLTVITDTVDASVEEPASATDPLPEGN